MREIRLHGSEGGEAKAFPTPIGRVRIAGGVLGLWYWRVDGGALRDGVQLVMGQKAAIDQPFGGGLAITLGNLVDHGLQLGQVTAGRDHLDADDHLAVAVAGELAVVGRPKAAIRHFHHRGLVVGGGGARRLGRLPLPLFDGFEFG